MEESFSGHNAFATTAEVEEMVTEPKNEQRRQLSVRDRIAVSTPLITVVGLIATFGAAVKWR